MVIIVDGYCLGNPGQAGYKGIDKDSKEVLFKEDIGIATNNIAEYLAIVHAFHYLQKRNLPLKVESDSITAISWIRKKKVNSSYKGKIMERVQKAQDFISTKIQDYELVKWDTKTLGENPADFGNKK